MGRIFYGGRRQGKRAWAEYEMRTAIQAGKRVVEGRMVRGEIQLLAITEVRGRLIRTANDGVVYLDEPLA